MRHLQWTVHLVLPLALASPSAAHKTHRNYSTADLPQALFAPNDRPDGCPPCFNCNLDDFVCQQFADCSKANGRCICPPGFGSEDCSQPLCGSLPNGRDRTPRAGRYCDCDEGWEGVNCNVCQTNEACNALMPEGEGGVCIKEGELVRTNYQMCNITNKKILDQLKDQIPQATFSCDKESRECNFQCECYYADRIQTIR